MDRTVRSPKLLVAGGAVVLASAAYALGTQAGGGSADASDERTAQSAPPAGAPGPAVLPREARQHRRDLDAAAAGLGVRPEQLRAALEELRPERPEAARGRHEFAVALAEDLGVDLVRVTAALEAQPPSGRPVRPARNAFFAALGTELGVSADKVEAAIRKVRPERGSRHDRGAFMSALAEELGVGEARLRSAFGAVGPGRGGPRGPRFDTAAFAQAVGVTPEQLSTVLKARREEQAGKHGAERAAFTRALAAKLDVSEERVTAEHGPLGGPDRRRGTDHGVGRRHQSAPGARRGLAPRP